ncbi:PhoH-like protein [Posidoniimonas polymericola]|uniref:PhoH-like protein n=1 Tax=Posidoniimonas polymericola TaxID=2528002 RepID=A0A5C5XTK2_9BACT|nr:PhoH family protein [Posidoniimonas polymericola]TWT65911.1 PhoH-like protein [Posidoniimonas polymericola]
MIEAFIPVSGPDQLIQLFGPSDQHLRRIREAVPAKIHAREGKIRVSGDEDAVLQATAIIERLKNEVAIGGIISPEFVDSVLADLTDAKPTGASEMKVDVQRAGVSIRPRTSGQGRYIEAIRSNDLVFCIGPAGTGKTYLAVAAAVEALRQDKVRKVVLVRPAVEAGESLGYLPGDLRAKINPYLRPLLDGLGEMMDFDQLKRYMAEDVIEVAPLAYMRGRTLNNAFIIMDEAQNTTVGQMKMFLTRMGANSRVVVTGDATQVDLPPHTMSGLIDARRRLLGIEGSEWVELSKEDIVRHRLVQAIVDAYEEGSDTRS